MNKRRTMAAAGVFLFFVWLSHAVTGQKIYLPLLHKTFDPGNAHAGDLCAIDSIVGRLYFAPAGTFIQGTPLTEVGRSVDEAQFAHTLTKNLAVMETEVTRQMWADLKTASQSALPDDPSYTGYGAEMTNPVQNVSWDKTILFANLLSLQQGLQRAYWWDAGFTIPIDENHYAGWPVYCNWEATGYRLPSEGEWEYFTRAGTTYPFSVLEPAYDDSTKLSCTAGALKALEEVAWFCSNWNGTWHAAGIKSANPWHLKDLHGSMLEYCWDAYGPYPTGSATDYRGAGTGAGLLRGGSWSYAPSLARSGRRFPYGGCDDCFYYAYTLGFRLVRWLPAQPGSERSQRPRSANR